MHENIITNHLLKYYSKKFGGFKDTLYICR